MDHREVIKFSQISNVLAHIYQFHWAITFSAQSVPWFMQRVWNIRQNNHYAVGTIVLEQGISISRL